MRPTASTLLKTVTGKVITGVVLVTMGVGAAAAAGADVVPSFVDQPATEQVEPADELELPGDGAADVDHGDDASDQTADQQSDDAHDESGVDEAGDDEERLAAAAVDAPGSEVEGDDEVADGESDTHGDVVSKFVHATDFEGCEKGQATAAVARGDVDPTSDTFAISEFDPYIERCAHDGDEGDVADEQGVGEEDAVHDGWKAVRDDGKSAVQELQAAADEVCGPDVADEAVDDNAVEDESPECAAAQAEVKAARNEWKSTWKTARDESKAGSGHGKPDATPGESSAHGKSNGNGKKSDG